MPSAILPPGELTAEVGKPYNVACLIDPKLGLQAEDVDFTCDGSPIPEVMCRVVRAL